MTLTCVQRKTEMFVWYVCACFVCMCVCIFLCMHILVCTCVLVNLCVRVYVCFAKERGVQYERVARANRATDSAPA